MKQDKALTFAIMMVTANALAGLAIGTAVAQSPLPAGDGYYASWGVTDAIQVSDDGTLTVTADLWSRDEAFAEFWQPFSASVATFWMETDCGGLSELCASPDPELPDLIPDGTKVSATGVATGLNSWVATFSAEDVDLLMLAGSLSAVNLLVDFGPESSFNVVAEAEWLAGQLANEGIIDNEGIIPQDNADFISDQSFTPVVLIDNEPTPYQPAGDGAFAQFSTDEPIRVSRDGTVTFDADMFVFDGNEWVDVDPGYTKFFMVPDCGGFAPLCDELPEGIIQDGIEAEGELKPGTDNEYTATFSADDVESILVGGVATMVNLFAKHEQWGGAESHANIGSEALWAAGGPSDPMLRHAADELSDTTFTPVVILNGNPDLAEGDGYYAQFQTGSDAVLVDSDGTATVSATFHARDLAGEWSEPITGGTATFFMEPDCGTFADACGSIPGVGTRIQTIVTSDNAGVFTATFSKESVDEILIGGVTTMVNLFAEHASFGGPESHHNAVSQLLWQSAAPDANDIADQFSDETFTPVPLLQTLPVETDGQYAQFDNGDVVHVSLDGTVTVTATIFERDATEWTPVDNSAGNFAHFWLHPDCGSELAEACDLLLEDLAGESQSVAGIATTAAGQFTATFSAELVNKVLNGMPLTAANLYVKYNDLDGVPNNFNLVAQALWTAGAATDATIQDAADNLQDSFFTPVLVVAPGNQIETDGQYAQFANDDIVHVTDDGSVTVTAVIFERDLAGWMPVDNSAGNFAQFWLQPDCGSALAEVCDPTVGSLMGESKSIAGEATANPGEFTAIFPRDMVDEVLNGNPLMTANLYVKYNDLAGAPNNFNAAAQALWLAGSAAETPIVQDAADNAQDQFFTPIVIVGLGNQITTDGQYAQFDDASLINIGLDGTVTVTSTIFERDETAWTAVDGSLDATFWLHPDCGSELDGLCETFGIYDLTGTSQSVTVPAAESNGGTFTAVFAPAQVADLLGGNPVTAANLYVKYGDVAGTPNNFNVGAQALWALGDDTDDVQLQDVADNLQDAFFTPVIVGSLDSDGDGVNDIEDACEGEDDNLDTDGNGVGDCTESATMSLEVDPAALSLDEGEDGTFTLSLSKAPSDDVTVTFSGTVDGFTLSQEDVVFTTTSWEQEITVTALPDADSLDHSATLTYTASGAQFDDPGAGVDEVDVAITVVDTDVVTGFTAEINIEDSVQGLDLVTLDFPPSGELSVTAQVWENFNGWQPHTADTVFLRFQSLDEEGEPIEGARIAPVSDDGNGLYSFTVTEADLPVATPGGYDVSVQYWAPVDQESHYLLPKDFLLSHLGLLGGFLDDVVRDAADAMDNPLDVDDDGTTDLYPFTPVFIFDFDELVGDGDFALWENNGGILESTHLIGEGGLTLVATLYQKTGADWTTVPGSPTFWLERDCGAFDDVCDLAAIDHTIKVSATSTATSVANRYVATFSAEALEPLFGEEAVTAVNMFLDGEPYGPQGSHFNAAANALFWASPEARDLADAMADATFTPVVLIDQSATQLPLGDGDYAQWDLLAPILTPNEEGDYTVGATLNEFDGEAWNPVGAGDARFILQVDCGLLGDGCLPEDGQEIEATTSVNNAGHYEVTFSAEQVATLLSGPGITGVNLFVGHPQFDSMESHYNVASQALWDLDALAYQNRADHVSDQFFTPVLIVQETLIASQGDGIHAQFGLDSTLLAADENGEVEISAELFHRIDGDWTHVDPSKTAWFRLEVDCGGLDDNGVFAICDENGLDGYVHDEYMASATGNVYTATIPAHIVSELLIEGLPVGVIHLQADHQDFPGDSTSFNLASQLAWDSGLQDEADALEQLTFTPVAIVSDYADSDGDGVPDADDQCPGEDDNLDVDGNGVPECTEAATMSLEVDPATISVEEGSEATFTLSLSKQPTADVSVAFTGTPDGFTLSHTDITFTTTSWEGIDVTITAPGDGDSLDHHAVLEYDATGAQFSEPGAGTSHVEVDVTVTDLDILTGFTAFINIEDSLVEADVVTLDFPLSGELSLTAQVWENVNGWQPHTADTVFLRFQSLDDEGEPIEGARIAPASDDDNGLYSFTVTEADLPVATPGGYDVSVQYWAPVEQESHFMLAKEALADFVALAGLTGMFLDVADALDDPIDVNEDGQPELYPFTPVFILDQPVGDGRYALFGGLFDQVKAVNGDGSLTVTADLWVRTDGSWQTVNTAGLEATFFVQRDCGALPEPCTDLQTEPVAATAMFVDGRWTATFTADQVDEVTIEGVASLVNLFATHPDFGGEHSSFNVISQELWYASAGNRNAADAMEDEFFTPVVIIDGQPVGDGSYAQYGLTDAVLAANADGSVTVTATLHVKDGAWRAASASGSAEFFMDRECGGLQAACDPAFASSTIPASEVERDGDQWVATFAADDVASILTGETFAFVNLFATHSEFGGEHSSFNAASQILWDAYPDAADAAEDTTFTPVLLVVAPQVTGDGTYANFGLTDAILLSNEDGTVTVTADLFVRGDAWDAVSTVGESTFFLQRDCGSFGEACSLVELEAEPIEAKATYTSGTWEAEFAADDVDSLLLGDAAILLNLFATHDDFGSEHSSFNLPSQAVWMTGEPVAQDVADRMEDESFTPVLLANPDAAPIVGDGTFAFWDGEEQGTTINEDGTLVFTAELWVNDDGWRAVTTEGAEASFFIQRDCGILEAACDGLTSDALEAEATFQDGHWVATWTADQTSEILLGDAIALVNLFATHTEFAGEHSSYNQPSQAMWAVSRDVADRMEDEFFTPVAVYNVADVSLGSGDGSYAQFSLVGGAIIIGDDGTADVSARLYTRGDDGWEAVTGGVAQFWAQPDCGFLEGEDQVYDLSGPAITDDCSTSLEFYNEDQVAATNGIDVDGLYTATFGADELDKILFRDPVTGTKIGSVVNLSVRIVEAEIDSGFTSSHFSVDAHALWAGGELLNGMTMPGLTLQDAADAQADTIFTPVPMIVPGQPEAPGTESLEGLCTSGLEETPVCGGDIDTSALEDLVLEGDGSYAYFGITDAVISTNEDGTATVTATLHHKDTEWTTASESGAARFFMDRECGGFQPICDEVELPSSTIEASSVTYAGSEWRATFDAADIDSILTGEAVAFVNLFATHDDFDGEHSSYNLASQALWGIGGEDAADALEDQSFTPVLLLDASVPEVGLVGDGFYVQYGLEEAILTPGEDGTITVTGTMHTSADWATGLDSGSARYFLARECGGLQPACDELLQPSSTIEATVTNDGATWTAVFSAEHVADLMAGDSAAFVNLFARHDTFVSAEGSEHSSFNAASQLLWELEQHDVADALEDTSYTPVLILAPSTETGLLPEGDGFYAQWSNPATSLDFLFNEDGSVTVAADLFLKDADWEPIGPGLATFFLEVDCGALDETTLCSELGLDGAQISVPGSATGTGSYEATFTATQVDELFTTELGFLPVTAVNVFVTHDATPEHSSFNAPSQIMWGLEVGLEDAADAFADNTFTPVLISRDAVPALFGDGFTAYIRSPQSVTSTVLGTTTIVPSAEGSFEVIAEPWELDGATYVRQEDSYLILKIIGLDSEGGEVVSDALSGAHVDGVYTFTVTMQDLPVGADPANGYDFFVDQWSPPHSEGRSSHHFLPKEQLVNSGAQPAIAAADLLDDSIMDNRLFTPIFVIGSENSDPDTDGDGIPDSEDACPTNDDHSDTDFNGHPDCDNDGNGVQDSDEAATMSIEVDTSAVFVTEGGDSETVKVSLSKAASSTVTIEFTLSNAEFTVAPEALVFQPGEQAAKDVTVTAIDDVDVDGDITGTWTLTATGAQFADASSDDEAIVSVTAVDDDGVTPPTLSGFTAHIVLSGAHLTGGVVTLMPFDGTISVEAEVFENMDGWRHQEDGAIFLRLQTIDDNGEIMEGPKVSPIGQSEPGVYQFELTEAAFPLAGGPPRGYDLSIQRWDGLAESHYMLPKEALLDAYGDGASPIADVMIGLADAMDNPVDVNDDGTPELYPFTPIYIQDGPVNSFYCSAEIRESDSFSNPNPYVCMNVAQSTLLKDKGPGGLWDGLEVGFAGFRVRI